MHTPAEYKGTRADYFLELEIPKLAECLKSRRSEVEESITSEERSRRIADFLEKHNLWLKYFTVFLRYVLTLEDGQGNEIWHSQGHNADDLCDRLLDFLEDYDKQRIKRIMTNEE